MKKIIILMIILVIPFVFAIYSGEIKVIANLDKCDEINVTVSANKTIDEGEYELINCIETESNKWFCECYDDYNLTLSTTTRTINNYSFLIEYVYYEDEVISNGGEGSSSGGRRGGSGSYLFCEEWTECINGQSSQNCYDLKNKNVNYIKYKSCVPEEIIIDATKPTINIEEAKDEVIDIEEEKSYTFIWVFWVIATIIISSIIFWIGFWFWNNGE